MGRTSSITMPSMVGIVGRAPAVDQKVWCFLSVCLSRFWNDEVCDNGNAMKQSNFQNIMASLHRGRFVVVHLCSTFPVDPKKFPISVNLYQKL